MHNMAKHLLETVIGIIKKQSVWVEISIASVTKMTRSIILSSIAIFIVIFTAKVAVCEKADFQYWLSATEAEKSEYAKRIEPEVRKQTGYKHAEVKWVDLLFYYYDSKGIKKSTGGMFVELIKKKLYKLCVMLAEEKNCKFKKATIRCPYELKNWRELLKNGKE